MAHLTLEQLKTNTRVTDVQLALVCSDEHLNKTAKEIDNYLQYAHALHLKPFQISGIEQNIKLTFLMKTQYVLLRWKNDNLFTATYLKLVEVALELGEGIVAGTLCELCRERTIGESLSPSSIATDTTEDRSFKESFSGDELNAWLKKIGLYDKDIELLVDEGFGSGPGFMELTEEDVDDMKFTRGGKKILKRNLISGPVPMDTIPPSNVMAPIPRPSGAAGGPPPPNLPYTPPPEPNTPDSLAEEIGLEPYVLDNEFPDSNYSVVLAFAKLVPDWPPLATSLGLSPQDKRAIETNVNLSYMMKVTEVFKKWKSRYGFKARYRMLIEAALRVDENLAMNMCRLVQKATYGSSARPVQNGRASSPPISPDKMVNMSISINTLIEALRPLHLSRSNNRMLARALKVPDYKISEFEANNPHDIAQVRTEILKDWLRNQPRKWSSISIKGAMAK